ncbi:family heavy metal efflux pump, putative [Babesia ovata]|uniref:Family heavy metal efflux pump, putative n=1 Tax=Babesia ovata TaxID=189622 RepID=A0A2H6K978_9APIC|nr:family heavy metal efflux pump, putative [Babesia ovata]GBE59562.1 family heavy metal efflux pump, putative [Babesia ovata]
MYTVRASSEISTTEHILPSTVFLSARSSVPSHGVEEVVNEASEDVDGGVNVDFSHILILIGVIRSPRYEDAFRQFFDKQPAAIRHIVQHLIALRSPLGSEAKSDNPCVILVVEKQPVHEQRHLDVRQLQAPASDAAVGGYVEHPAAERAHVVAGVLQCAFGYPGVRHDRKPDDACDFLQSKNCLGYFEVAQQVPVHKIAKDTWFCCENGYDEGSLFVIQRLRHDVILVHPGEYEVEGLHSHSLRMVLERFQREQVGPYIEFDRLHS